MQGLAQMQDDIYAFWLDDANSQQDKDQAIRDFGKCLDTILDLTSPATIAKEVVIQTLLDKQNKGKLAALKEELG